MHLIVRCALAIAAIAALSGATACDQPPTGPSLSAVTVDAIRLQSTTGDSNLCCCRIAARVTNNNSVAVHLTLKFSAYDGRQADPLSTIIYFIDNLQPRAVHSVDAAGLLMACSLIRDIRYEVEVRGLTTPPR